jgi:hypothetical protein
LPPLCVGREGWDEGGKQQQQQEQEQQQQQSDEMMEIWDKKSRERSCQHTLSLPG